MNTSLDAGERILFCLIRCALACILITLICGVITVLFYFKGAAALLQSIGIEFQNMRPLHTTFASSWIFLGGVTCVFKYLSDRYGEPTRADRIRFRFQMVCWGLAGAGILLTVPFGLTSGREYLGFRPLFSLLIVAGWLAFTVTFLSKVRKGFWDQPVYVYMWATGIVYFIYAFAEAHVYLLPWIGDRPVVDLQIQWKSCGSIVASFNMLVYGALIYLNELISGDKRYAQSTKGFALMGIGMLNSFTNYAHHTYHVPQSDLVQWIAFVVSMLEIVILVSVFNDVRESLARRTPTDRFIPSTRFIDLARQWTLVLLVLAIAISIPPLNSLVHGTRLIMAHAMVSEIGIDSFVLFAVFAFLFNDLFARCWSTQEKLADGNMERTITMLNLALAGVFAWLFVDGVTVSLTRASSQPVPDWLSDYTPLVLASTGGALAWCLAWLVIRWWPFLVRPAARRIAEKDRFPD